MLDHPATAVTVLLFVLFGLCSLPSGPQPSVKEPEAAEDNIRCLQLVEPLSPRTVCTTVTPDGRFLYLDERVGAWEDLGGGDSGFALLRSRMAEPMAPVEPFPVPPIPPGMAGARP